MKIIKQGNLVNEEVIKKIKCSNCNSELEYNDYDIIAMQDLATSPLKKYILCPVCNNKIEVS